MKFKDSDGNEIALRIEYLNGDLTGWEDSLEHAPLGSCMGWYFNGELIAESVHTFATDR